MQVIYIHDLKDPNDPSGRTYKQINTAKTHSVPIGSLVEFNDGVRMFVVCHERDCDMTPLYHMCYDKNETRRKREGFRNSDWTAGWPEDALTVIRLPEGRKK